MDESEVKYIDAEDPNYGISLTFLSNEKCTDTQNYKFTIDVRCSEDAKNPIPRLVSSSVLYDSCNPRAYIES